jgi:glutamyl/glutaminyl-tRNA synthetase
MRARFNSSQVQETAPEPSVELGWACFADRLPPYDSASEAVKEWFDRLMALHPTQAETPKHLVPEKLAAKAAFLFGFDADAARAIPENRAVLATDAARIVLAEFAERARVHEGPVHPQEFEGWMDEIAAATGVQGGELAKPVRIALTGRQEGPEISRILLLIEDPVARKLGVPSVRDRIERFVGV